MGGWGGGWVAGLAGNIANSAQLMLKLGLRLAKSISAAKPRQLALQSRNLFLKLLNIFENITCSTDKREEGVRSEYNKYIVALGDIHV